MLNTLKVQFKGLSLTGILSSQKHFFQQKHVKHLLFTKNSINLQQLPCVGPKQPAVAVPIQRYTGTSSQPVQL